MKIGERRGTREVQEKKQQTIRQRAKDFRRNYHTKSRKCTGISDRQRKARITGGKSQTGKVKAINTRGESQAGRKRQEDQSGRQKCKAIIASGRVRQVKEKQ
jgi:hypothetical protein